MLRIIIALSAALLYIILEYISITRPLPMCKNHYEFSERALICAYCSIALFMFSGITQLRRAISLQFRMMNGLHIVFICFVINSIAATSVLAHILHPQFYCLDGFGLVTVPLLSYTTVMKKNGILASQNDICFVLTAFLTIFFGLAMNFFSSQLAIATNLFLSCFAFALCYYFLYLTISSPEYEDPFDEAVHSTHASNLARRELAISYSVLVALIPCVYFVALAGLIDAEQTFIALSICDICAKGLYAQSAFDSHLLVLQGMRGEVMAIAEANENKGKFMKYLLHEVGVPLNTLVMGINLLHNSDQLQNKNSMVNDMKKASDGISTLMSHISTLNSIHETMFHLQEERVSLKEVVNGAIAAVQDPMLNKHASINFMISSYTSQEVVGDMLRIQDFVKHLLLRIITISKVNVNITIGLKRAYFIKKIFREHYIALVITDDNPRLKEGEAKAWFIPFNELESSVDPTESDKHLALQLIIGNELLKAQKGFIRVNFVESSPLGNMYALYFPLPTVFKHMRSNSSSKTSRMDIKPTVQTGRENHDDEFTYNQCQSSLSSDANIRRRKERANTTTSTGMKFKALIAEDMPSNGKMLQRLLANLNVECDLVGTGNQVIHMVTQMSEYKAIFLSKELSEMSGVETVKLLRQRLQFDFPVIAITSNSVDTMEIMKAGADMLLEKPLTKDILEVLITCICSSASGYDARNNIKSLQTSKIM